MTRSRQCRIRKMSCLDCSTDFAFPSPELDAHTSCISEADKYGHTKNKKRKQQPPKPKQQQAAPEAVVPEATVLPAVEKTTKAQVAEARAVYKQVSRRASTGPAFFVDPILQGKEELQVVEEAIQGRHVTGDDGR